MACAHSDAGSCARRLDTGNPAGRRVEDMEACGLHKASASERRSRPELVGSTWLVDRPRSGPEPHHADADSQADEAHQRLQQEVGESMDGSVSALCPLQLL